MQKPVFLLLLLSAFPLFGQQTPPVDELLKTARYVATLQQHDLSGNLRKDGKKVPVTLFLNRKQGDIQFQFLPKGEEDWKQARIFHMRLEADHYDLFEMKEGKTSRFPDTKLAEHIEGTDLTYEDLSMNFLYWPNGQVIGEEKIKGQECWKIRLNNPGVAGSYKAVIVSVHKKAGALMQVNGYDGQGRAIKQFQVSELMKVGKSYTLRRMRVNTYEPVSRKTTGITYVEFDKPKSGGGGFR